MALPNVKSDGRWLGPEESGATLGLQHQERSADSGNMTRVWKRGSRKWLFCLQSHTCCHHADRPDLKI